MSPGAAALAVLLHAAAALALWWMTVNRPALAPVEQAIEITVEKPKPPDPPPPEPKPQPQPEPKLQPQAQPKPQPAPPLRGVPLPAEITADRRTQVAPSGDQPKDIAGPQPRSLDDPAPAPQPPAQAAVVEPPEPKQPPPRPPVEQAAPPPAPESAAVSLPPPAKEPPPTPQEQVAPKPPPSTPAVTAVNPPPRPQTPPAVTPHPQPRPTPQIARPQERPPAIANRDTPPSSSPFVNPADTRNRALAGDNYLQQILRKLRGYRFSSQRPVGEAHLVVGIVIARNGQLVSVDIIQSSGIVVVDQGALNGIRAGSPYTPLPPEIGGNSASFSLPLISVPVGSSY